VDGECEFECRKHYLDCNRDPEDGCEYHQEYDEEDCPELNCEDGQDNDSDGDIDCYDRDCAGERVCQFPDESECDDGEDNDRNGKTDCEDENCRNSDVYRESDCNNGEDNDNDGDTDCDDSDCYDSSACFEKECDDGEDTDDDGQTDCLDSDCDEVDDCEYETEETCAAGWSGTSCETDDWCGTDPCQNDGTCYHGLSEARCACTAG